LKISHRGSISLAPVRACSIYSLEHILARSDLFYEYLVVSRVSDVLRDLSQRETRLYEKLLMMFPGYRGYKEKELVRETDRVVRDKLFRMLKKSFEDLRRSYSATVSREGLKEDALRLESLIFRVDSLAERTRHASYGYRPLFHVTKVDEEKLVKMLEHDLQLANIATSLNTLTERMTSAVTSPEELRSLLSDIERLISEYEAKLSEREDILSGFTK